ncbi:hypothetical protein WJX74_005715 [Apatococcus lobatus]|uniref:Uncharacterized protein n=1 Tax=Apatococcus lobatus TaxID=904363 RepID=A0AAW1QUW5_9CHLO
MPPLADDLRGLLQLFWSRLARLLTGTPPQTIALTGVLGLAAFLYGIYQLRQAGKRRSGTSPRRAAASRAAFQQQQQQVQSSSIAHQQQSTPLQPACAQQSHILKASQPAAAASAANTAAGLAGAVRAQLAGVSIITMSAPGVLLQETEPHQLQDGACMQESAAEIVGAMAQVANVFILAQVEDEIGEATVRCALEEAELLGLKQGQVKPHRLLFCSTLEGKVSMVRQLEPGLHVDAAAATIESLQRFMPQLLYIQQAHLPPPASGSNIGIARSLAEVFQA